MSASKPLIAAIDDRAEARDFPDFRVGDTIRVHVRIVEGDKTRIQVFEGVCIRRRRGGVRASFTVRKFSHGVGVEKTFPVLAPRVETVEVVTRGRVRRNRLYYLRERTGKAARIKTRRRDAKR